LGVGVLQESQPITFRRENMMIVARLEGKKNISDIIDKLKEREYEVSALNDQIAYVSHKNRSSADLSQDVKSVKKICEFKGQITCYHGINKAAY
jgi:vacuolar-type H+-ATPase subunit I/STV1